MVACCLLILQPYPVLHDYPEWMYQGFLVGELLVGNNASVNESFALVSYPVPNAISQLAMGLLNLSFPPVLAGQIWLAVYFVFATLLWRCITRSDGFPQGGAINLILTLTITLGSGFWNGYINFQFGVLFFSLYLYLSNGTQRFPVVQVFVFSLLIFLSHAAVYAALVVLVCVQRYRSAERWRYLTAMLPSLLLLAWYTLIKLASGVAVSEQMTLVKWIQYKTYTVAKQGPFHNFILPNGESLLTHFDWLYVIGFGMNFLIVLLLLCWASTIVWHFTRSRGWRDYIGRGESPVPILVTVGFLMSGFLVAGQNSFGVVNLGERFLVVAIVLLLVFFQCPKLLRRIWTILAAVSAVYLMVATVLLIGYAEESYSVARSANEKDLEKYVDDIYASSRHKYFNHRLFIYSDRGGELVKLQPGLLPIDLATSIVVPRLPVDNGSN
ncbi:hypothetical protein AB833_06590 [Chromatiales bacterium (ex Bugula neritina AB1)]|nr:hypothetical protein AB833_06590 [Chromatiales bacterium (ex Bugula neritina AB1)]